MLKVFQTLSPLGAKATISPQTMPQLPRPIVGVRIVIVLSFLILGLGCGNPDRARIVGRWEVSSGDHVLDRVDHSATADRPIENDAPQEEGDPSPRLLVEFFHSGALQTETRISNAISKKSGTWSWVDFDGDRGVAKVKCELIGQTTEHEVVFVSEDEIKMVPPNMAGLTKKMVFKRN